jgi:hypothetical protein
VPKCERVQTRARRNGARLIADVEVYSSGEADAVLNVRRAIGKARMNDVTLDQAQIESVIDVKIHAAAALEIERGGITGEHAVDRVLT